MARFLAVLELYREGRVALDQVAPLGDLYVTWTEGGQPDHETSTEEADE